MPETLTHRMPEWDDRNIDAIQSDWEMEYFNQEDDGPDQLRGEWYSCDPDHTFPDGSRVIIEDTFGNDNSPGASDYTTAELYGPDERDEYDKRVTELEGFPEYLESDDDTEEHELPTEPEDDDYQTNDHMTFFQNGKKVVEVSQEEFDLDSDAGLKAVRVHMDRERFWPNVWYVNERGTPDLLTIPESG